jgi:hypothetical protein
LRVLYNRANPPFFHVRSILVRSFVHSISQTISFPQNVNHFTSELPLVGSLAIIPFNAACALLYWVWDNCHHLSGKRISGIFPIQNFLIPCGKNYRQNLTFGLACVRILNDSQHCGASHHTALQCSAVQCIEKVLFFAPLAVRRRERSLATREKAPAL